MIHPDIIDKYAPDPVIGKAGSGVGVAAGTTPKVGGSDPTSKDKGSTPGNHQAWISLDGDQYFNPQVNVDDNPCYGGASGRAVAAPGGGGILTEEVATHSSKKDYWVDVAGEMLDLTGFLSEHPGCELANLTFDGKDPTEELNMIHPDIIGKYAPGAAIGKAGSGVGVVAGAASQAGGGDPTSQDKSSTPGNHQAWENLDGDSHLNPQVNVNDNMCCGAVSGRAVAASGGGGIHMEEVAKHSSKKDYWVVMAGDVLDFTGFLSEHAGGELANLTFDSKDAAEEFNMIHTDIIDQYAPDAVVGKAGSGVGVAAGTAPKGGGSDHTSQYKGSTLGNHLSWANSDGDPRFNPQVNVNDNPCDSEISGRAVAASGGGGIRMEEVANQSSKKDYWLVVAGEVLDFTGFLSEHPGGELVIPTFDGKDAKEEFNMIHPDIIGKYAPDALIGKAGSGVGVAAVTAPQAGGGDHTSQDKGSTLRNHQAWENLDGDLHFNPQVNVKDNLVYGSSAGHQVFCPMNKGTPEVLITMRVATKETDNCKLSSDSFSD